VQVREENGTRDIQIHSSALVPGTDARYPPASATHHGSRQGHTGTEARWRRCERVGRALKHRLRPTPDARRHVVTNLYLSQRPIPRVAPVRTDVGALGGGTSLHPAGGTFVGVDPWRGGLRRGLGLMWLRGALPGAGMVYRYCTEDSSFTLVLPLNKARAYQH
jgi:hypothetical protein